MNEKNFVQTLRKIGLTENESKVYFSLLTLGPSSSSSIAKASGVKRTTTYSVLTQLLDRSFIKKEILNEKEIFVPLSLDKIMEEQFKIIKNIKDFIPIIHRFKKNLAQKPEIESYEGNDYLKKASKNFFIAKDEILSWVDPHFSPIIKNESLYFNITRNRVKNKIFQKVIIANNLGANKFKLADKIAHRLSVISNHPYIDPEIHIINNFTLIIYKNINYSLKITCERFTNNLRMFFLSEWGKPNTENYPKSPSINAKELKKRLQGSSNTERLLPNKNDIKKTISKIVNSKSDPRDCPIPEIDYDFTFNNYQNIGISSNLNQSKLSNVLNRRFKGISYFNLESRNNPVFKKNFLSAEKKVYARECLIPSLSSLNKFFKKFGFEIYLLDGFRTAKFQKEIWDSLYKNSLDFYKTTSSIEVAKNAAKNYTSQIMKLPPKKANADKPSTWFAESTGGNVLLTLISTNGYSQDFGNLHLYPSKENETNYYEINSPKNDKEKLIQTNRRMLFWGMLINGWYNNPLNIFNYDICSEYRTQQGIFFAQLWGLDIKKGANLGPASK